MARVWPKALYSDFQIPTWCAIVGVKEPEWRFPPLHSFDSKQRKAQIASQRPRDARPATALDRRLRGGFAHVSKSDWCAPDATGRS